MKLSSLNLELSHTHLVFERFAIGPNLRAAQNSFAQISHLWTKFAAFKLHLEPNVTAGILIFLIF